MILLFGKPQHFIQLYSNVGWQHSIIVCLFALGTPFTYKSGGQKSIAQPTPITSFVPHRILII